MCKYVYLMFDNDIFIYLNNKIITRQKKDVCYRIHQNIATRSIFSSLVAGGSEIHQAYSCCRTKGCSFTLNAIIKPIVTVVNMY